MVICSRQHWAFLRISQHSNSSLSRAGKCCSSSLSSTNAAPVPNNRNPTTSIIATLQSQAAACIDAITWGTMAQGTQKHGNVGRNDIALGWEMLLSEGFVEDEIVAFDRNRHDGRVICDPTMSNNCYVHCS